MDKKKKRKKKNKKEGTTRRNIRPKKLLIDCERETPAHNAWGRVSPLPPPTVDPPQPTTVTKVILVRTADPKCLRHNLPAVKIVYTS